MEPRAPLALVLPLVIGLAACGDKAAPAAGSGAPGASGAPAKSAVSTASAAHEAPPTPKGQTVTGEIETRDKKKIAFSIELPEGLSDVSERPQSIREYAKEKGKYDGYTVQVMQANPEFAKGGLDSMLKLSESDPDAKKNNAKLLDKGGGDDAFYMAHSIEEGGPSGKKAVLLFYIAKKGEQALQCRGNVEGPLANEADTSLKVILAACKSLKITS
jgi:hypothetical protein